MNEAILILPNMRGGCATVGNTVHTLFRVTGRRPRPTMNPGGRAALPGLDTASTEPLRQPSSDDPRDSAFSDL